MSSIVPSPLHALIAELMPTMRRGDLDGFRRISGQLSAEGRRLRPDELSAAVGELAPVLAYRPEGVFARLALTAGAFVEWGGSPVPLAENSTVYRGRTGCPGWPGCSTTSRSSPSTTRPAAGSA